MTQNIYFYVSMKKENNWFECEWCGKIIPPAEKTSRNHCSNCFMSLHVDQDEPWDRLCTCKGRMIPETYEIANGQCKILFRCIACGHTHINKCADDDEVGDLDMRIWFRKQKYAHLVVRSTKTPKRGYQQRRR